MESTFEPTLVSWGYGSSFDSEEQLFTDPRQGAEGNLPLVRNPAAIRANLAVWERRMAALQQAPSNQDHGLDASDVSRQLDAARQEVSDLEAREALQTDLEAKLRDALIVEDLARLRTVVAVPPHAPLWLYWAQQLQCESGDAWTDGAVPVMACAAVAAPAAGEGQMHGGAVMVSDGWQGPLWLRVVSPEPAWASEGIGATWHLSTRHAEPVRGGLAAPDWIKAGRTYAPAPLRGEPCPPWRS